MSDDDPQPKERPKAFVASIGIAALIAWFALLWLMFGNVL